jgi:hypothetical protein
MATNPRIPEKHQDVPTLVSQKRKKGGSPLVPLGILVAAILLIAIILWLPRAPKRPTAPSNAVVPSQPTGNQVQISNVRMSPGPAERQMYIYARLSNAGTTAINGMNVAVTFPGQNGQPADTITTSVEGYDNGYVQPLGANPIKPSDSRDVRIPIEQVPQNWNHQAPEIKVQDVTSVGTR